MARVYKKKKTLQKPENSGTITMNLRLQTVNTLAGSNTICQTLRNHCHLQMRKVLLNLKVTSWKMICKQ